MIIAKHEKASWLVVEELGTTERGSGGYGSTGK
jgi:dUTP pyrophosphatase